MTRFTSTLRKVGKSIMNEVTNLVTGETFIALNLEKNRMTKHLLATGRDILASKSNRKAIGVVTVSLGIGLFVSAYVN